MRPRCRRSVKSWRQRIVRWMLRVERFIQGLCGFVAQTPCNDGELASGDFRSFVGIIADKLVCIVIRSAVTGQAGPEGAEGHVGRDGLIRVLGHRGLLLPRGRVNHRLGRADGVLGEGVSTRQSLPRPPSRKTGTKSLVVRSTRVDPSVWQRAPSVDSPPPAPRSPPIHDPFGTGID